MAALASCKSFHAGLLTGRGPCTAYRSVHNVHAECYPKHSFPAISIASRRRPLSLNVQDKYGSRSGSHSRRLTVTASTGSSAVGAEPQPGESDEQAGGPGAKVKGFLRKFDAAEIRAQVAKLGAGAILAYGLFDGITYTTFFVLAFLGYEAKTGQNPAANLKALLGIVVLMWTGNNVTRPFRLGGAAALAPVIDRGLEVVQKKLRLPKKSYAFFLVMLTFASMCFSVVGLLILSRLGK